MSTLINTDRAHTCGCEAGGHGKRKTWTDSDLRYLLQWWHTDCRKGCFCEMSPCPLCLPIKISFWLLNVTWFIHGLIVYWGTDFEIASIKLFMPSILMARPWLNTTLQNMYTFTLCPNFWSFHKIFKSKTKKTMWVHTWLYTFSVKSIGECFGQCLVSQLM